MKLSSASHLNVRQGTHSKQTKHIYKLRHGFVAVSTTLHQYVEVIAYLSLRSADHRWMCCVKKTEVCLTLVMTTCKAHARKEVTNE